MAAAPLAMAASSAQNRYQANWASIDGRPCPKWYTDSKFGIFIHWGVYSVPAYAPVIPGKLAYAEWYWNAMTNGQGPKANPIQAGTWGSYTQGWDLMVNTNPNGSIRAWPAAAETKPSGAGARAAVSLPEASNEHSRHGDAASA